MYKAVIANTDSKIVSYHWCESLVDAQEWVNSYLTFHGLSRIADHVGYMSKQFTAWVQA